MKVLIISILLLTFSIHLFSQDEIETVCKDLDHIIEMEKNHNDKVLNFTVNELTQDYDLKYHRLEWNVDPADNFISGTITSYFVPLVDEFNMINFDLVANMNVTEVIYNGIPLTYTLMGTDNLQISFPSDIPYGQLDSVTVSYEGDPNTSGFGSFEVNTHGEDETPVMWTLSEPYGAKAWWPCKQDLIDKIDSIDIIVTTPSAYRVASNGILVSEKNVGSDKIYHWKHRYAIPAYLISIAITDYAVFSDYVEIDDDKSIEILNYVYPEDLSDALEQLESTVEIMEYFNEYFGIYPFANEKYGHAQFGWGGGMEHQTMSSMGGFSYSLQAHELAHQWFGDKVTCGSWEHIWLNEGFATYLAGVIKEFRGDDSAWMDWKSYTRDKIVEEPDGSVWVDDTTSVSRIFDGRLTYRKGSFLVHMLRWKLGDEDFFQGIKNYLEDPDIAYGYAVTKDLQAHLEAQSGQDLEEFFDDWFYGQGHPSYDISWFNFNSYIEIRIKQTSSHSSVDFFEMPIPIYVSGDGQDTLLKIEHTYDDQVIHVDLPFFACKLEFDPTIWLLSKDNIVEEYIISVEETRLHSSISVSPSPFNSSININLSNQVEIKEMEVTDALGKRIYSLDHLDIDTVIDTQNWASGVYHVVFRTESHQIVKRIVK